MRFLTIISLFLLTSITQGQKVDIFGSIESIDSQKLSFVSIYQDGNLVALSDENGYFSFVSEYYDTITLSVNSLGFKPITKKLILIKNRLKYQVDFVLETDYVKLEEINITEKAINVFDINNWNILDYLINENNIFILTEDIPKTYLYVFDIKGKLLSKKLLDTKYKKLFISCLGGYHLIGNNEGSEFLYINQSIEIKKKYKRKEFEDFLLPCKLKYDSILIFKGFQNLNKRVQFYYYNENKEKEIIFDVFNVVEAKYTSKEYRELIHLYYKTISKENNDPNSVIFHYNIIEDGNWSGDLLDLVISYDLMFKVMWFKNISLKKINADIINIDNKLFGFDFENNKYGMIPFAQNSSNDYKLNHFEGNFKTPKIITDTKTKINYIVSDNRDIYKITKIKDEISVSKIYEIDSKYYFPRRISIADNQIYFLIYDNTKSLYNQIVKKELF